MKKLLTFLLIMTLIFISVDNVFGEVHNTDGDFPYYGHDTGILIDNLTPPGVPWFTVKGDSHYLNIAVTQKDAGTMGLITLYSFEEFQNDQMLGVLNYLSPANLFNYLGNFRCSYLFSSGVALGVDYHLSADKTSHQETSTLLSAGYRYNFKNAGFVALSVDYLYQQALQEIYGYDLDFKYLLPKMKISGQVYQPSTYRGTFDDTLINLQLNYQLFNFLVLGGILNYQPVGSNNTTLYQAGFSLTAPAFAVNGKLGQDNAGLNFYKANGSVEISSDYSLGIEYLKEENKNDPKITYILNSNTDNLHLALTYSPGANGASPVWGLIYKIDPFNQEIEDENF